MSLREESVSLKSLGWDQPGQHYFPIQDPFDPTRDVGRAVNRKGLKMMMRACFIAKTKLLNGHDPAELFVQYPQVQRAQEPDKM